MKKTSGKFRISILSFFIFLAGAFLVVNVLLLDFTGKKIIGDTNFKELEGVSTKTTTLVADRGVIVDSNDNVMAMNITVYKIAFILDPTITKTVKDENGNKITIPNYVQDKEYTAQAIADILGGNAQEILGYLNRDKKEVQIGTVGSNITYEEKLKIDALNLPGIRYEASIKRYYPLSNVATHLIGYIKTITQNKADQMVGISGIEKELDNYLTGSNGYQTYYKDASGNIVVNGMIDSKDAEDGYEVKLTLNHTIQNELDDVLESIMGISDNVSKAWGIVINAKTGAILGYDSYPTFDSNIMNATDYNDYCASVTYEPGSVMKSFAYATALDLNPELSWDEQCLCDNYYLSTDAAGNPVRVEKGKSSLVIHNSGNGQYGMISYRNAYSKSLNVGTVCLLEKYIGKDNYINYMNKFGFYKKVNIFGINEGSDYGSVNYSDAFSLACAAFGSGETVNALQLVQAYTTFANEGMMIKPYIIESITNTNTNQVVYQAERTEIGQVVSATAANSILELMEYTVYSGTHKSATQLQIDGVKIGCKTGTAPVALANGGYSETEKIHSVMVGMPIENPEVFIYIAYQDNYTYQRNFKYVKQLEKTIASALNLNENKKVEEVKTVISKLDNFVNHSLDYVKEKQTKQEFDLILIGNGDTVIKQYPNADSSIVSNQKVFVLTSQDSILMPNMKGWTRSEVTAFWDLTGIAITINGSGRVTKQNIVVATQIEKGMEIIVDLE